MRLLTRSDFDGLVCGALLKAAGIIDSWLFVHPKDMQDGSVHVNADDVLANVPFVSGCAMWFDHHSSEITRMGGSKVSGECRLAPSCARVIYDYYGGAEKFPNFAELVEACDKVDSGQLTREEVLNPKDGVLLGFIMDPRTGLGRFRNFTVSNLKLMEELLTKCAEMPIEDILYLPDVQERVDCYYEQTKLFEQMIKKHTSINKNVIVTDLRGVETINAGNRFFIYSLYPLQNVSLWIVDGRGKQNVSIAIGYSVLNRSCSSDIGAICASYGGGGHKQVGTCQVDYSNVDTAIREITEKLTEETEVAG